MSILFIGTINSDCYPDTVWGARKGTIDHPFYLPEVIVWGRYDKAGLRGRKDTTEHCKGHIPKHRQLDYTLITYPAWSELRGSVTAFMLNPEDTLVDLMLAIRGSVGQGAERRDTMRLLALFGQSGLDTLASIDVGSIAISQIEPFAAMELRKGAEVNNEKQRDLSGRTSYELSRPSFREKKKEEKTKDTDTASPHASPAAGTTAGTLRVYPNPTGVAAQVEATSIPAGEYSVEIVAVNGEVSDRQEITVPESGTLLQRLDVEHLPTGYYMIRLRQRGTLLGTLLGTYPIVVTH